MILKKGTQVRIISGKDKGKTGEILEINRKLNKVKVKSINMVKRHTKPTKENKREVKVAKIALVDRNSTTLNGPKNWER